MRNSPSPQQFRSYRERRAQSRSNNISSANSKGLQEIEESISLRTRRLSMGQQSFLSNSLFQQSMDEMSRRQTEPVEEEKMEEPFVTKLIQKYVESVHQIKEVNQDELITSARLNPESGQKLIKGSVPNLKLVTQTKRVTINSKANLSKNLLKTPDSSNLVTPRKIIKPIGKEPKTVAVTLATKVDRKPLQKKESLKIGKVQQLRFLKKLEMLEEEMGRLGFQKEREARFHFKNILDLLRDD